MAGLTSVRTPADWIPRSRLLLLAFLWILASCSGLTDPDEGAVLRIDVEPAGYTFTAISEKVHFNAVVRNGEGAVVPDAEVDWSTTSEAIIEVSSTGVAVARATGMATVVATCIACVTVSVDAAVQQVVTDLEVNPTALVLQPGQSASASVRPLDRLGNLVADASVEWSTSKPWVVSVDEAGNIMAAGEGSGEVIARVGGLEVSVAVTVGGGSGSGPPGDGDYPNEPAGFERWVEHDFSCVPSVGGCELLLGRVGFGDAAVERRYEAVQDPSAPGGTAVRINFPAGLQDGTSPGRFSIRNPDIMPDGLREYYSSAWIMMEGDAWESPPAAQKLWYEYRTPSGGGNTLMVMLNTRLSSEASQAGAFLSEFEMRPDVRRCSSCVTTPSGGGPAAFRVGQWNHLEIYRRLSGVEQANGVLRVWVNGTLVINRTDVRDNDDPDDSWIGQGLMRWVWAPVYGGTCVNLDGRCPKTRDDYMRLGHVYISGRPMQ